MVEALVTSNIILWILVIVLALLVFALARQVGILHERVAPAGALQPTSGPKVGELTEALQLKSIDETNLTIGGPDTNQLASFVLPAVVVRSAGLFSVLCFCDKSEDVLGYVC